MKKIHFIVLLFIFTSNLYAQNESKTDHGLANFRIGIFYSLDKNISSERIEFDQYTGYSADYDKINYKIGINFEYLLNSNFSLNSGIIYSNKNFTGTYFCDVCDFIIAPQPQEINLQYLEIPLTARYYFMTDKLKFFLGAGFINQFTINSTEVFERKYVLSGKFDAGIEYNMNEKLAVQFIAEYSKGLSNIFKNSKFKNKILGLGLAIIKRF